MVGMSDPRGNIVDTGPDPRRIIECAEMLRQTVRQMISDIGRPITSVDEAAEWMADILHWAQAVDVLSRAPFHTDTRSEAEVGIERSERGFKFGETVEGRYGSRVSVSESSNAEGPHLWVHVWCPADLTAWIENPDAPGARDEAIAELDLAAAESLYDRLGYLIGHHYQKGSNT